MASKALTVNGKRVTITIDDPDMPLLYALRDNLALRRPRFGPCAMWGWCATGWKPRRFAPPGLGRRGALDPRPRTTTSPRRSARGWARARAGTTPKARPSTNSPGSVWRWPSLPSPHPLPPRFHAGPAKDGAGPRGGGGRGNNAQHRARGSARPSASVGRLQRCGAMRQSPPI